LPPK